MVVGISKVELHIYDATSLKEKRAVLQSLLRRIRNTGQVSAAEVDYQDKWQRSAIGLAVVSAEVKEVERMIAVSLALIEGESRVQILSVTQTVDHYDDLD